MSLSIELVSKVNDYLDRRVSARDLEDWLAPRLPVLLERPESQAGRLAGLIELCFAELHAGIRSERAIKTRLRKYVGGQQVAWLTYPPGSGTATITSSSAVVESPILTWPSLEPSPAA